MEEKGREDSMAPIGPRELDNHKEMEGDNREMKQGVENLVLMANELPSEGEGNSKRKCEDLEGGEGKGKRLGTGEGLRRDRR